MKRKNHKILFIFITLLVLGFSIYYNSLGGKFIWDEEFLIVDNRYIKEWRFINIKKIFTEDIGAGAELKSSFYRPLQILTYMIDYSFWNLNPIGYHFINICLHILVSYLIFWLTLVLFNNWKISFLTSALFLTHPVHTEAAAYIPGRTDLLSALFILLSTTLYIKQISLKNIKIFFLILLSYMLALLSREYSLIVPVLLLLYSWVFRKKILIKEYTWILVISLFYIVSRMTILKHSLSSEDIIVTALYQRMSGFFVAITEYCRILLLPFHLHMEYVFRSFRFTEPSAIAGLLILLTMVSYAFRTQENNALVSFSILWFFLTLLPLSNLYPINAYMSEHWLYIPSIGFFLLVSNGLIKLYGIKKLRLLAQGLIVFLLCFYSYSTIRQNNYWKDKLTFSKVTLRYVPNSPKIYNSLCEAYMDINDYQEAVACCRKAINLKSDFLKPYYNLANCDKALGRYLDAIAVYKEIIEKNPREKIAYFELGSLYEQMKETQEAKTFYQKAIAIDQKYFEALNNLAALYAENGEVEKGIELWEKIIQINPDFATAHFNLAAFYFQQKKYDSAIKHCDKVIELGNKVDPRFLKQLEPYRKQSILK